MSDHDDQFLNDVLKATHFTRYTHSVDCAAFRSNLLQVANSMQELVSYAPIKVLSTSPMQANEGSNQSIRINFAQRKGI